MNFAEAIKEERTKRNLDVTNFAKQLGVSQPSLRDWENRSAFPYRKSVVRVAEALGWPEDKKLHYLAKSVIKDEFSQVFKDVLLKSLRLGMFEYEIATVIDINKKTFASWKYDTPKSAYVHLNYFLDLDDESILEMVHYNRGKGRESHDKSTKRGWIDYDLLNQLFERYSDLGANERWPVDDPDVVALRAKMNVEVTY